MRTKYPTRAIILASIALGVSASPADAQSGSDYAYCIGQMFDSNRGKIAYLSEVFSVPKGRTARDDSDRLNEMQSGFFNYVRRVYGNGPKVTCHWFDSYSEADDEMTGAGEYREDTGYSVIYTNWAF